MTRFRIDSRKQDELLASLFNHCLVYQENRRQVGGGPPTGLLQPSAELLDPTPDGNVRPLNANLAKHARDLSETHPEIVQQERQLNDLAIRPLTLENSISSSTSVSSGRFDIITSERSRIFPSFSLT